MKIRFAAMFLLMLTQVPFVTAQPQSNATLRLTGRAHKMVTPDVAVFSIDASATDKDESEAVKKLNALANETLTRLKKEGFTEQQIKLTGYAINVDYQYNNGKNIKTGYTARQNLMVKFPLDRDHVLHLFNNLSANNTEGLQINFSADVSDDLKTKTSDELIQQALKDAERKATLMAQTAKYKIKGISNISYDVARNIEPVRYEAKMLESRANVENNANYFTVNEVEFDEEVEVTYNIATE